MIQTQTIVDVVDNSGAKSLRCIKVVGGFKKRYGLVGSVIKASIKELRHKSNKKSGFKKGDLVFAIVVQLKSTLKRKDGQTFNFFKNAAIIVDKQMKPLATRISIPLCHELRQKSSVKLTSLAPFIF